MKAVRIILGLALCGCWLAACSHRPIRNEDAVSAEARAVEFLKREVPAWSRDNGCFSCHNNGDAARALYAASRKGYRIPKEVLAETTHWLARPERWNENKGDPGFSDQRLADVQFAAALAAAIEAGAASRDQALSNAAERVARGQDSDGSWPIDVANPAGSPATYGGALATYMAWEFLNHTSTPAAAVARQKAAAHLQKIKPDSVANAAVLLLSRHEFTEADATVAARTTSLDFLRRAQTRDGGWGPYADSPAEAFDTSLALLALASLPSEHGITKMMDQGRRFLATTQLRDGSWPATTRPSGGTSYAQQISTTGWATLALLSTH